MGVNGLVRADKDALNAEAVLSAPYFLPGMRKFMLFPSTLNSSWYSVPQNAVAGKHPSCTVDLRCLSLPLRGVDKRVAGAAGRPSLVDGRRKRPSSPCPSLASLSAFRGTSESFFNFSSRSAAISSSSLRLRATRSAVLGRRGKVGSAVLGRGGSAPSFSDSSEARGSNGRPTPTSSLKSLRTLFAELGRGGSFKPA